MTAVRSLWNDLVERRLWPVAVGLLVALVAVPMLLAGGDDPAAEPAAPVAALPATAGATASAAAIKVAAPATGRHDRAGAVRNPFRQQKGPSTTDSTTVSNDVPAQTSSSSGPSTPPSSTPGGSNGPLTPVTPSTPSGGTTPSKPKVDPVDTYHVNIRFGRPGAMKVRHDIARLSPLPSSSDPFFVFLGVLADGKTAVFLVSSDAAVNGDGTCKPTPTECETVEMKAGDVEFFDVTVGTAGVVQYELDLLRVDKQTVHSARAAKAATHRMHTAGANVVREARAEGDPGVDSYEYDYHRGTLRRVHHLKAGSAANVPRDMTAHTSGAGVQWRAAPTFG